MARRQQTFRQKIRTREHVVGDLAFNHVERQVLRGGCTVERISRDYGLDPVLFTCDDEGQLEDGAVYLQVKGTEQADILKKTGDVAFRIEHADARTWLRRTLPVLLVVYDVGRDMAFCLHVQDYFDRLPGFDLATAAETMTVRIPSANLLTPEAVRGFALLRDAALP